MLSSSKNLLRYLAEKILLLNANNFREDYPMFELVPASAQIFRVDTPENPFSAKSFALDSKRRSLVVGVIVAGML